ncbi:MAG: bifunctional phosphoribosyl-AMP cyclohydrolase/phosphoribosyl-ATP diphosphatase HisIE [Dehalococcoidia bacterium]|nr:bifunctional phosphoribosyl-AMP cyclohydrolase/phosphoribosyl-ATP diphosphatase HisIE [Dehalococcoidia bacterium]
MIAFNSQSLLPAIVQDAGSKEVLMLGYMNPEALLRTVESGQVWFWSRSRAELWHKGDTSGSFLNVKGICFDCDGDAVLLQVDPEGPVCHTGKQSCFFNYPDLREIREAASSYGGPSEETDDVLGDLFEVIQSRKSEAPEGSYVASLFSQGIDKIGKKVIEEAGEVVIAAKNPELDRVVSEMADLWFHSLILLSARGLTPKDIWEELLRRRK